MSRRAADRLLLTCEHGGNRVPPGYAPLFAGRARLLASHRGLDIGSLQVARALSRRLDAPLIAATVTRLLVDLNRSPGNRGLFSAITGDLPEAQRSRILARHYHPYRNRVRRWIAARVARGERVLHVSVHSFTPVLDGRRRRADVGLLHDPGRPGEVAFCRRWQEALATRPAGWVVRRNYPYRGTSDGQVVDLRRRFPPGGYVGVELEVNQALLADPARRRAMIEDLATTLPR